MDGLRRSEAGQIDEDLEAILSHNCQVIDLIVERLYQESKAFVRELIQSCLLRVSENVL